MHPEQIWLDQVRARRVGRGRSEAAGRHLALCLSLSYSGRAVLQLQTLNDILFTLERSHRERAVLVQDRAGAWLPLSSAEVVRRVRAMAAALRSWGIGKGDRVAILAENRWEWAVADFACLGIGAVDVPLYPTLLAEQIRILLAD